MFRTVSHSSLKNGTSWELWIRSKDFLKIFPNEISQVKLWVQVKLCSWFFRKILQGNWPNVGPKIMHAHNPGFTSRISLKFATIKAKSHIKVILVFFFEKKSYSEQLGPFGPKNATLYYYNSGSAVNTFFNFAQAKR